MVNFEQAAWSILGGIIGKQVKLEAVSVRPEKTALLKYFILMNVSLRMDNHRWIDNEPVADFLISPPKTLFPVRVLEEDLSSLLETLPILLIAAACADGTSMIPHHPECTYIIDELLELGANITITNGMLTIIGQPGIKHTIGSKYA